ncbi:MAG: spore cortex biosynthesis protein YabQ [Clostridia bacterium]|jgi:hypothetical protein|nr:spore cortex biosynthesis protein YabQ [Clostridia bacterium]MDD3862647.1 spore cortex biosynthesis protein YabQ [Clostridia bacterium]MDD4408247.1 spore cortex biosynthesis protein YabQ [Clostridia bacterium]
MLFETLYQPLIMLQIIGAGFLCGLIFDVSNGFWFLCNKNKILRIIFDAVSVLAVFAVFFFLILDISFGEIRAYQIIIFVLSVFLERISLGKLIANFSKICYIKLNNVISKWQIKISKMKVKKSEKKKLIMKTKNS